MNALNEEAHSGKSSLGGERDHLKANPGDPSMGEDFQITFAYLLSIRKPLIAAINGPCAGLGIWTLTRVYDEKTGELVAECLLNSASLKSSYANYEKEAQGLGKVLETF